MQTNVYKLTKEKSMYIYKLVFGQHLNAENLHGLQNATSK